MNKQKLINLVNDLYWDYDRMSSSGQETLNKIFDLLSIKKTTGEASVVKINKC